MRNEISIPIKKKILKQVQVDTAVVAVVHEKLFLMSS